MGNLQKTAPQQSIEDKLYGLMPMAISDQAQADIELQIDQLTGLVADIPKVQKNTFWKPLIQVAAMITLAVTVFFFQKREDTQSVKRSIVLKDEPELTLINTTNRVQGLESDGLIYPDDGTIPHYRYRYKVSNEELIRDEATGLVITVTQPSHEVVTIPVTYF